MTIRNDENELEILKQLIKDREANKKHTQSTHETSNDFTDQTFQDKSRERRNSIKQKVICLE